MSEIKEYLINNDDIGLIGFNVFCKTMDIELDDVEEPLVKGYSIKNTFTRELVTQLLYIVPFLIYPKVIIIASVVSMLNVERIVDAVSETNSVRNRTLPWMPLLVETSISAISKILCKINKKLGNKLNNLIVKLLTRITLGNYDKNNNDDWQKEIINYRKEMKKDNDVVLVSEDVYGDNAVESKTKESVKMDKYWVELGAMEAFEKADNVIKVDMVQPKLIKQDTERYQLEPELSHPDAEKLLNLICSDKNFKTLQDDKEFVRMVAKRLAGRIKEIVGNEWDEAAKMVLDNIISNMEKFPETDRNIEGLIKRALSTKGSAGRYLRHTNLQPIIKEVTLPIIMNHWKDVVNKLYCISTTGLNIKGFWTSFEMYMKNELLPASDESKANVITKLDRSAFKVTRLIQAGSLPARVLDAIELTQFNDRYASLRDKTIGKIGIKYHGEMSALLDYVKTGYALLWDFSDYDGSQSPFKMRLIRDLRKRNIYNSKEMSLISKTKSIVYLNWKYDKLIHRNLKSKWGVRIFIIGGRASGDITTSDDNTIIAEIVCQIVKNLLMKNYNFDKVEAHCQGDDALIQLKTDFLLGQEEKDKLIQEVDNSISSAAFFLKFLHIVPIEESEFLSAMKATSSWIVKSIYYECPVTIRDYDRHYPKMLTAYENSYNSPNKEKRSKCVSKMVSYLCLSTYMPIAWLINLVGIMTMADVPIWDESTVWLSQTIDLKIGTAYDPKAMHKALTGCETETMMLIYPTSQYERTKTLAIKLSNYFSRHNINIGEYCSFEGNNKIKWQVGNASLLLNNVMKQRISNTGSESQLWKNYLNTSRNVKTFHEQLEKYETTWCEHFTQKDLIKSNLEKTKYTLNRLYTCDKCRNKLSKTVGSTTLVITNRIFATNNLNH